MKHKLLYTGMVSLAVALGGFLMGFDAGVVSGANPFYKDYFFLSDWALGWSVGCLTFGAMLGNAIAGPLADRFGRKPVLIVAAFYSRSLRSLGACNRFQLLHRRPHAGWRGGWSGAADRTCLYRRDLTGTASRPFCFRSTNSIL